jgi:hypothetical protein
MLDPAYGDVDPVLRTEPGGPEPARGYVDVVFDGPPDHTAPRFIELENEAGQSIRFGEWVERPDGFWALWLLISPGGARESVTDVRLRPSELATRS